MDFIKTVLGVVPASPGMYACMPLVDETPARYSFYELVTHWAEVVDIHENTRVVGVVISEIGKPHTEWEDKQSYTCDPPRNNNTKIVR